jgi:tetratricopeptide (TPR) repeat protein
MPNMMDEGEIIDGLMTDADAALARGSIGKAGTLYHGILRLAPNHAGALRQLAAIEVNGGNPAVALELFMRARQVEPMDVDLYHGIATALRLMDRAKESEVALTTALKLDPAHGPSLYDMAMLLQQRRDHAGASKLFLTLAAQGGMRSDAMFNRGVSLYRMGNLMAAERWFHAAAQIDATSPKPLINLGMIYRIWGFVKEALACQEQAVKIAPDNAEAHWNLANALLVTGDFARGFAEYEWRFKRPGRGERPEGLALNLPRWDGTDLGGKTILITLEQGLGDAIHFIRFAADVAARGGRVVVECRPELARLLATARGVAAVVAPGTPVPEAVCYAPLMSLPHLLGVTLDSISGQGPYLKVPPGTSVPDLGGAGLRVGLVWRGNPQHENDRWRSISLKKLAPLLDVPGITFFSLQLGAEEERAAGAAAGQLIDLAPHLTDFARTAAVVQALDLVISVDTAVAHLAGALGKPVWVLIAQGNDWRWLHERSDSPWYPTLRLYRQQRQRRWDPAINRMKGALADMAAAKQPLHDSAKSGG